MTNRNLDRCKELITIWCEGEYGESCLPINFEEPEVSILFSYDGGNDEHTVQVCIDIPAKTYNYYYDGKKVYTMRTKNIRYFMEWLENMDWQEEYGLCVINGRKDGDQG